MLKVLRYLQKMRGSEDRMGKLIRRKDKFETVLIQEWKAEQERSKLFIR